jgi:hypothetical protein
MINTLQKPIVPEVYKDFGFYLQILKVTCSGGVEGI